MATAKLQPQAEKKPVPRIEWWENHLGKFNYRMVGGIITNPETIGGGANQGFDNWGGIVKNIKSQASFKGLTAIVSKTLVIYSTGKRVPVIKVKKPR